MPSFPGTVAVLLFAPVGVNTTPTGQGLVTGCPHPDSSTETTGSPRFLGNPLHACPALRPRWDLCARPLLRFGAAFRASDGVGSHENRNFEAQSHGPHARCLRFAGWVAPAPARLASGCLARRCRARGSSCSSRWVPYRRFLLRCFLLLQAFLAHRKFTVSAPREPDFLALTVNFGALARR